MTNNGWDTGAAQFDISPAGHFVYATGGVFPESRNAIVRVTLDGRADTLVREPHGYMSVSASPAGNVLASYANTGTDRSIFLHDIERDITQRMNTGGYRNLWPIWSPDGRYIAFTSDRENGVDNAYRLRVDGIGDPERLAASDRSQTVSSWSSSGDVAYLEGGGILPASGSPAPFFTSAASERYATFSPNTRWLAYVSNESGRDEVWVRPYPGPGAPLRVSANGGHSPLWSPDSRTLYFIEGQFPPVDDTTAAFMAVQIIPGSELRSARAVPLLDGWSHFVTILVRSHDILPDGSLIAIAPEYQSAEEERRVVGIGEVHIVLNFIEELEQRLTN
jgi:serine/threonine-protein kinase